MDSKAGRTDGGGVCVFGWPGAPGKAWAYGRYYLCAYVPVDVTSICGYMQNTELSECCLMNFYVFCQLKIELSLNSIQG